MTPRPMSRQPALVQRFYRVGFGLSLDQKKLADGSVTSVWDTRNFSNNNYSPAALTAALKAAFAISDAPTAVWIWGTLMLPWLPSDAGATVHVAAPARRLSAAPTVHLAMGKFVIFTDLHCP
jgi:hypothetical protein